MVSPIDNDTIKNTYPPSPNNRLHIQFLARQGKGHLTNKSMTVPSTAIYPEAKALLSGRPNNHYESFVNIIQAAQQIKEGYHTSSSSPNFTTRSYLRSILLKTRSTPSPSPDDAHKNVSDATGNHDDDYKKVPDQLSSAKIDEIMQGSRFPSPSLQFTTRASHKEKRVMSSQMNLERTKKHKHYDNEDTQQKGEPEYQAPTIKPLVVMEQKWEALCVTIATSHPHVNAKTAEAIVRGKFLSALNDGDIISDEKEET